MGSADLDRRAFGALALALPVALFFVHQGRGHAADMAFFHEWYLAFREGAAFYRDGPGVNYPILGALLVCAPAWGLEQVLGHPLELASFRLVHKLVLVAGEVSLVFAAAALARTLGAPRPRWLALALYALPSTWAGGAWFGQTDVWGTVALLLACDALIRFRRDGASAPLAIAVLALQASLLLKPLCWFALPVLGLLLLEGLCRHGSPGRWALVVGSCAGWLVPDALLTLPDGRTSHLLYVLFLGQRDHGTLTVANGASLWALLPRDHAADQAWLGPLTPRALGSIAWVAIQLAVGARWLRRGPAGYVRAAGLAHLSMALVMTGVHERYLVHAVPLLLLVTTGLRRALVVGLGVASGLFVLESVEAVRNPLVPFEAVVLLSVAALIAVAIDPPEAVGQPAAAEAGSANPPPGSDGPRPGSAR